MGKNPFAEPFKWSKDVKNGWKRFVFSRNGRGVGTWTPKEKKHEQKTSVFIKGFCFISSPNTAHLLPKLFPFYRHKAAPDWAAFVISRGGSEKKRPGTAKSRTETGTWTESGATCHARQPRAPARVVSFFNFKVIFVTSFFILCEVCKEYLHGVTRNFIVYALYRIKKRYTRIE